MTFLKTIFGFVALFIALSFSQKAGAVPRTCVMPSETIALQLPIDSPEWKEITRYVAQEDGVIELIPVNQTIEDWSDLIAIQYFDISSWGEDVSRSIDAIARRFRNETESSYPGGMVTWKIIEKNQSDVIFEWILDKPYKNIPPQHQIDRIFIIEDRVVHRVGFTHRFGEFNLEEREAKIKLLKESTSVVSLEQGTQSKGSLSIVDRLKGSIDLGPGFRKWRVFNTYSFENGFTEIAYLPPSETGAYVTECLEVDTMPTMTGSVDDLFEADKKKIQSRSSIRVPFRVLKKTPNEIIYSYFYPKDFLQLNAVVRTISSDQGYCSITYKRGLKGPMKKEQILLWQEKLELIKTLY